MVYLYYTGSENPNESQTEIQKSLGGFISSTLIPNSSINSIFRDDSQFSKNKDTSEIICIAIKNESSEDLDDFTFYIDKVSEDFIIEAAFVKPSSDNCGNLFFEKLKTQEHKPYYANFENVTGEDNAINIGKFTAKSFLGLFISKKINKSISNNSQCKAIDFQNLTEEQKVESIDFIFSWE